MIPNNLLWSFIQEWATIERYRAGTEIVLRIRPNGGGPMIPTSLTVEQARKLGQGLLDATGGHDMIRNYDELVEYMAVQGLIDRKPRQTDGQMAMRCTKEGAQICYLLLALIGGEQAMAGERIRRDAEQTFREMVGDDAEIEGIDFEVVSPVENLIHTTLTALTGHPRFSDAITAALERRG